MNRAKDASLSEKIDFLLLFLLLLFLLLFLLYLKNNNNNKILKTKVAVLLSSLPMKSGKRLVLTHLILLPQVLALFMTSLPDCCAKLWHTHSCVRDFQTSTIISRTRNRVKRLLCVKQNNNNKKQTNKNTPKTKQNTHPPKKREREKKKKRESNQ